MADEQSPVQITSVLNWTAPGTTVANATIVPAGPGGAIDVVVAGAATQLLIDINGYFAAFWGDTTTSFQIVPQRIDADHHDTMVIPLAPGRAVCASPRAARLRVAPSPEKPGSTPGTSLTEEQKQLLIQNGTYNADSTVNVETARRLGWDRVWAERERPSPKPAP